MKKNHFKHHIPDIKDVVKNKIIRNYIKNTLVSVLNEVGIQNNENVVKAVLKLAVSYKNIDEYEKAANAIFKRYGIIEKIPKKLKSRADTIYSQVAPYLKKGSVLDLGCGDGEVGRIIANSGLKVALADVYKHANIDSSRLNFVKFLQGKKVPMPSGQYDSTLLLTVLHHSDNPITTLREAKRLTKKGGQILVIESVYGINDNSDYGKLEHEEQRLANVFFDHFYNRVIHYSEDKSRKVNVPFNFNSPAGWKNVFEKLGLKQRHMVHLGRDQAVVPEYHTLHVVDVK